MAKDCECYEPSFNAFPRRSARLRQLEQDDLCISKIMLPSPSVSDAHKSPKKRKRPARTYQDKDYHIQPKKRKIRPEACEDTQPYDAILHWIRSSFWPKNFWQRGRDMSQSSKRRSDSTHRSQTRDRLAFHGILTDNSDALPKDSRVMCDSYLEGNHKSSKASVFSPDEFTKVLRRVRDLNEARIQRDVTPWIVPSAETLYIRGHLKHDWIGEEIDTEWIRCATMGSTRPKPDYVAGLQRRAFTTEELQKLDVYASAYRPFHFTPELCFPFLICEAKTGESGLNKADRQNLHSAGIAIRAIVKLYQEAFRGTDPQAVHQLLRRILVFTVSHDNDKVCLYAHFAHMKSDSIDEIEYHRYSIALYSLSARDGMDRLKAYNFVLNVYEKFAPIHRRRLQYAVARLPTPTIQTSLSFSVSEGPSDRTRSQESFNDDAPTNESTPRPHELTVSQANQIAELKNQMDILMEQLERQRQEAGEQLKGHKATRGRTSEG